MIALVLHGHGCPTNVISRDMAATQLLMEEEESKEEEVKEEDKEQIQNGVFRQEALNTSIHLIKNSHQAKNPKNFPRSFPCPLQCRWRHLGVHRLCQGRYI